MTRSWRIPLFAALALLAIVVPAAVTFYTDWLWFGETGYQDVFLTNARGAGHARRRGHGCGLRRPAAQPADGDADALTARSWCSTPARDRLRSPSIAAACSRSARRWPRSLALLFGLYASAQWQEWLLFRHAQPFGDVDPVLGKDVGFYVFRLPFLEVLRGYLLALVAALRRCRRCGVRWSPDAIDVDLSRVAADSRVRRSATWRRSPPRCSSCSRSARISTCRGC